MRLLQLSDLHLEFMDRATWQGFIESLDPEQCDAVALCGDIITFEAMPAVLGTFSHHFAPRPVLYVPGNHDYWHTTFDTVHKILRKVEGRYDNFHWLHNNWFTLPDSEQRILGTTLWYPDTDLAQEAYDTSIMPPFARRGRPMWSDFEWIQDSQRIFEEATKARQFFENELRAGDVVMTHMLPSEECVTPRWKGQDTNVFFVHELADLIRARKPRLWMHGHTHDTVRMVLGDTEISCNPRGYHPAHINPDFHMVVHTLD